jgi:hypothetical protein
METCKAGIAHRSRKRRFRCRGCRKFFIENPEIKSGSSKKRWVKADLPSRSRLMLELKAIGQELGSAPTTKDWVQLRKQERVYPIYIYYAVFGSFLDAVKLAKLKPRYKQEFDEVDREKMLEELRVLSRKLKRPLFGEDVFAARKKKKVSPINHYQIAFETVPAAIAAAGVAPKIIYTREEMIGILRKLDAKLDRPVQKSDIDELYHAGKGPAAHTLEKKFGGMAKARRVAGVIRHYRKAKGQTRYWQKYTPEELIEQLKRLGKKLGRKPTDRDINAASKLGQCASAEPFTSIFGSLREAYRAAGFFEVAKTHRRHTDAQIIAAIKKLKKELGKFPGYHDLRKASIAGKCPTPNTINRRLGKLTEIKLRF